MKHILLFVFSFFAFSAVAQTLTDDQVKQYLDDLQKEEILSELGKDGFLKFLNKENPALKKRLSGGAFGALNNIPDSLMKSRAAILGYIGVFELMRNVGSAADDMVQIREMGEKLLSERMFFKPDMEGQVNPKNPLSFLSLEQNLTPSKENYLLIAERLKAIKLIDQRVYDELVKWLEKGRIKLINDFGFFIYAARQTWFYDNYEDQKRLQFKYIDSLQVVKLLSKEKGDSLKKSYQPYELKSKVDILSLSNYAVVIPKEHGNFTREEIYENLFKQINTKLIPALKFTDFSVSEITPNSSDQDNNLMGLPFSNPMDKNKKPYRLQYSVNGFTYAQKADTDFSLVKNLIKTIPPDVNIDSTIIQSYVTFLSPIIGINTKDFRSINDFLIDQKSDKRLIVVGNEMNPLIPIKDARKVILLVDSTQSLSFASKFQEIPFLGSLFGEKSDFSDKMSRENLSKILQDFQEHHIIPIDSKEAIDKAIVDFRFQSDNRNNVERGLLLSFPSIIAQINFNPKEENEKKASFKNFINELSRVSNNQFKPEKINDNFENEVLKSSDKDRNLVMSYRLKDKKYEYKQEIPKVDMKDMPIPQGMKKDFLNFDNLNLNQYDLIGLVNSSLEENNIDGQFYEINARSGMNIFGASGKSYYIFLNQEQYSYIEQNHHLIFNEPIESYTDNAYNSYKSQIAAFNAEDLSIAMQRENMLSQDSVQTLDLKNAKEPSDVLKASAQVVVIDMNELADKTDTDAYTYIIEKFGQKLLPKATFSNINYTQKGNDSTEYEGYLITAKIDGKPYEQTLYTSIKQLVRTSLDSLKSENAAYFPSIGENQFKVINDYLTDINSPQRLVIVCDYRSPRLSFVLFDSTQATLVEETLPNNYVDFAMYSKQFSRDSLQNILYELSRIGLCEPMSDSEKEDFILKFRRMPSSGKSFLKNLPKVVTNIDIVDLDDYSDIYKTFIDSLKTISHNQFKPTKVEDNFAKTLKKSMYSKRLFEYSFVLNNKKYSEKQIVEALPKPKGKTKEENYPFFDLDKQKLIDLINKALAEQNSDYAFYELSYIDEDSDGLSGQEYVFLTSKQYHWIKSKFPEIFQTYDDTRMYDSDKIEDGNKN